MAAIRPRITFTPEPDTLDVLQRLAGLQGRRASAIVADMMSGITPQLADIADVLGRVKVAEAEAQQSILLAAEEAQQAMLPHADAAMSLFRAISDAVSDRPPSSNTGVTTPPSDRAA